MGGQARARSQGRPLKIAFAGTGTFAVPALRALCGAGHTVTAVYTAPDRPAGRGRRVSMGPVKRAAAELALTVRQPPTWRDDGAVAALAGDVPDVLVVADYGLILPARVLRVAAHGAVNVHASALPRWRGAAPVARAILAGDAATGVCIIAMDAGIDTGPLLATRSTALLPGETAGGLEARLALLGAACLVEVLARFPVALAQAVAQAAQGACYAAKLGPADAVIDWRADASVLDRQVRALSPAPLAYTHWRGKRLRVHAAEPRAGAPGAAPGTVLAATRAGIDVAAGSGVLRLTQVQIEGGRALSAAAFLAGHRVAAGETLASP